MNGVDFHLERSEGSLWDMLAPRTLGRYAASESQHHQ